MFIAHPWRHFLLHPGQLLGRDGVSYGLGIKRMRSQTGYLLMRSYHWPVAAVAGIRDCKTVHEMAS
jgi:hypothetical protein